MAIISDPFPLPIVYCFRYASGGREEMASRSSIPRVFSSPRKSECLLSAAVIKVGGRGGGGGQRESVSPSRDGWGPELLVAAGEGHQRTDSPCPAAPTSQVGAVSTSRKISRLEAALGQCEAPCRPQRGCLCLRQPVQRSKVNVDRAELTSPFFHLLPVFNQEAFPFPFPLLPKVIF